MIKWTVSRPRVVAEDTKHAVTVEAASIEEAVIEASTKLCPAGRVSLGVGEVYLVSARVRVAPRPKLPLESV